MMSMTVDDEPAPTPQNVIELGCDTRIAIDRIDKALPGTVLRDMIPAAEVQALLLDLRNDLVNN